MEHEVNQCGSFTRRSVLMINYIKDFSYYKYSKVMSQCIVPSIYPHKRI